MYATWRLSDFASARAGGHPLPNAIRFLLVTASFGSGIILGELLRLTSFA